MSRCKKCGNTLCSDEISVYLKLVSRSAKNYLCKCCLAECFGCSVSVIDKKITQFKANNCQLFCQNEDKTSE